MKLVDISNQIVNFVILFNEICKEMLQIGTNNSYIGLIRYETKNGNERTFSFDIIEKLLNLGTLTKSFLYK